MHHQYLLSVLILLPVWIGFYWLRPDLKEKIIISSLVCAPLGITQPLYVPGYWNPQALLGFTISGIYFDFESILYSFTVGGIAAGKYEFIFSKHLRKLRDARQKISHDRKVILGALITFTLIPAILFEQFMWATLSGLSAGTLTTLYLRKDLIRESLFGGITFLTLHFGILIFLDPVIYPGWISEVWTVEGILGVTILTVPLGEVLFAFLFGTLWAPFYETIEGYRIAE